MIKVATDSRLPSSVRAHAWLAASRSPAGAPRVVMEAADEERHPAVRRAAVLTLRRAATTPIKSAFLKKLSGDSYARYAALWADVA